MLAMVLMQAITCPSDAQYSPADSDSAVAYWSPAQAGYQDVSVVVSSTYSSGSSFSVGNTQVTYTARATGPRGAVSTTCSFEITVHGTPS